MNLRDIKKDIDYILSAFIEDCSLVAAVNSKVTEETASELMDQAIDLYNDLMKTTILDRIRDELNRIKPNI